ncbi:hypothetical protein [Sphaerimonospora thailandensis]|uniref:Uncharacterized protein n=1 Tax=Sphaerimonospora thailandensis TaxID=795644 RepID=A0A8J3VX61_9ACTN|nr:hypothetical protein [Sphaerimonospora thailandensis]GIH68102.1 hypothetical protein Mth01_03550 [Sphaerimonospora thailandensis]
MTDVGQTNDDLLIRGLIGRAARLSDEGDPDDYRTVYPTSSSVPSTGGGSGDV